MATDGRGRGYFCTHKVHVPPCGGGCWTRAIVAQEGSLAHVRHDGDPWMQTFTGRKFYPLAPMTDDICIEDIAHHLSMRVRFAGATLEYYSVAQHSVLVSHACRPKDALWGLLHDAPEAYLGDMIRPMKHSGKFPEFIRYEHALMQVVCDRFDLSRTEPTSVKFADAKLLATEKRDLLRRMQDDMGETWLHGALPAEPLSQTIRGWSPEDAAFMFLDRFKQLTMTNAPFSGTLVDNRELEDGGW